MQIKKIFLAAMVAVMVFSSCKRTESNSTTDKAAVTNMEETDVKSGNTAAKTEKSGMESGDVTAGTEKYRGFILDNIYHSPDDEIMSCFFGQRR